MKTTIEVNDQLFRRAKQQAAAEGVSLRSLLEEALQRLLDERQRRTGFKLRDGRFRGGEGLRPEFAEGGWERIRNEIYRGHGA